MAAASDDFATALIAIARGHGVTVVTSASATSLATQALARDNEFFDPVSALQAYAGHTALHAAAFAYDVVTARALVAAGADIRARNRRGAEPLHAATMGAPGSPRWKPAAQRSVIEYLVAAGADPNAAASQGITPLHRAVRNRCSAAVETLLRLGADPLAENRAGSTPAALAVWNTGRGGTGSPAAQREQQYIVRLLDTALGTRRRTRRASGEIR